MVVISLERVYTIKELKDCGGMCIMHVHLSTTLCSGSWKTMEFLMWKTRSICFACTISSFHALAITSQSLPEDGTVTDCQQKETEHQCKFGYRDVELVQQQSPICKGVLGAKNNCKLLSFCSTPRTFKGRVMQNINSYKGFSIYFR